MVIVTIVFPENDAYLEGTRKMPNLNENVSKKV
jgi:hypothetical protein